MRQFYNEIKGMKVKELPNHLKPMFSIDYVKKSIQRGLDNYHAKYIQTSSVEPLFHVCYGGMIFSYLVALPEERRHLEHQQHAKEHGGHWSIHNRFTFLSRYLIELNIFCSISLYLVIELAGQSVFTTSNFPSLVDEIILDFEFVFLDEGTRLELIKLNAWVQC